MAPPGKYAVKERTFAFQPLRRSNDKGGTKHPELAKFHEKYLDMDVVDAPSSGKGNIRKFDNQIIGDPIGNNVINTHVETTGRTSTEAWKQFLPKPIDLYKNKFGKPDTKHSFTQQACGETVMHLVLKSGFLQDDWKQALCSAHPLIEHLDKTRIKLESYDFAWLRNINKNWATQK